MDPDGRSLLLAVILLLASLGGAYALGAFSEIDEKSDADERDAALLGMTPLDGAAAASALLALAGAVFCAAGFLRRLPWLALVLALVLPMLYVLAFALGAARHPDAAPQSRAARVFAAVLGRPFLLLPRALFRAGGLSARTPVTEEDVLSLVDDVEEGDFIDESQKEMISGVFELDDIAAGDIMTHRTEVAAVPDDTPARDIIPLALDKGYSRLPVYRKTLDEIVGILYVKDLLTLAQDPSRGDEPVSRYLRPAMFVPESCRARELLLEFRAKHTQIAVVVDEYGGTAGLVSMEDILEEIVGNIEDEFDKEDDEIRAADGGCTARGAADLDDVFAWFGMEPPERSEEDDFDSVGGLITSRIGRIPRPGEEVVVDYHGLRFRVLQMGERRVERVFCSRVPAAGEKKTTENSAESAKEEQTTT